MKGLTAESWQEIRSKAVILAVLYSLVGAITCQARGWDLFFRNSQNWEAPTAISFLYEQPAATQQWIAIICFLVAAAGSAAAGLFTAQQTFGGMKNVGLKLPFSIAFSFCSVALYSAGFYFMGWHYLQIAT